MLESGHGPVQVRVVVLYLLQDQLKQPSLPLVQFLHNSRADPDTLLNVNHLVS